MRIGIIGHFGGSKQFNDGQTIKTKSLYDGLRNHGIRDLDIIDTFYVRKRPLLFTAQLIKAAIKDKKIIALLSINGRRVLFPILYILALLGKEVYHYSIGGRLAREVSQKPKWKNYINSFQGNWMESKELVNNLQALGINNAVYIPNFKKLMVVEEKELLSEYSPPFRFCTFSRVMPEKGIEDAIDAIISINNYHNKTIVTLDIYGPIEKDYTDRFFTILEKTNQVCKYCGVVDANKSVNTLKNYYMLIFPTRWRHEGIPGTIIDALSAGVPIIARKWQYCEEMITDHFTGLIYDFEKPEMLIKKLEYSINNEGQVVIMKKNCIREAKNYSEDAVIKQIKQELEIYDE